APVATGTCPDWKPIDVGEVTLGADAELSVERGALRVEELLERGELVRAAAIGNATWQACLAAEADVSADTKRNLGRVLARLRVAAKAPRRGEDYVQEARARLAEGDASGARAAWDLARIAYLAETNQAPQPVTLIATTPAAAARNPCMPSVQLDVKPKTHLSVQALSGSDLKLWRLDAPDGATLFRGVARLVVAVTNDSWLVLNEQIVLMRTSGEVERLGTVPCGSGFRLFGDWLIGVAGEQAHLLNLAHPERSFRHPLADTTQLEVRRVGPYIEISHSSDAGPQSIFIFRSDIEDPAKSAWSGEKLPSSGELRLYDVPRWGGVLLQRESVVDSSSALGFGWKITATRLETGEQLSRIDMPGDVEYVPAMTVDGRHGLIVTGQDKDVRVAKLGSRVARKLSATPIVGQVETIRVVKDLVCTDQVVMGRYYSCDLNLTADLTGAARHRAKNRFCIANGEHTFGGVVPPEVGHEHVASEGRTVMYGVCGQRLDPAGKTAAFIEVKPRPDHAAPFTGAQLVLLDTRTMRRLRRLPIEGTTQATYAFIDVEFSPSSTYVATLFGRHVDVFRLGDGAQLARHLPAEELNGIVWLDDASFTGGTDSAPVFTLQGDEFARAPAPDASSSAPDPENQRCLFGTLLTPAEVCGS
ncbi:MAG: hypothetical protein KC766_17215, partial [Myxococcales bacterium]|nr:hypothetical protein [Myxococcales bacterium]